jgi:hypothetical protein
VEGLLKLGSIEMEEIPVSLRKETVFAYPVGCRGQENVYLYIHSPVCFHGVVLN